MRDTVNNNRAKKLVARPGANKTSRDNSWLKLIAVGFICASTGFLSGNLMNKLSEETLIDYSNSAQDTTFVNNVSTMGAMRMTTGENLEILRAQTLRESKPPKAPSISNFEDELLKADSEFGVYENDLNTAKYYVACGSFRTASRAQRLIERINEGTSLPDVRIFNDGNWHQVRVGNQFTARQTEKVIRKLIKIGLESCVRRHS